MTNYSYPFVIGYELVSKLLAILVLLCPDIIATDNDVATLSGILLIFPCLL